MTEQELSEIEARADAATPGPWTLLQPSHSRVQVVDGDGDEIFGQTFAFGFYEEPVLLEPDVADVKFIAHAREDVPKLIAEVRRLRRLVDEAEWAGCETNDGMCCVPERACPWCDVPVFGERVAHAISCPAFTPEGDVK